MSCFFLSFFPRVRRDTGFAGGSAALKFTSFKLMCTSELVLRPHTGLMDMIANTGGPNNVMLMNQEVDFTRGGSILSIDPSGSDHMASDAGAPRVKGKAAYFPFEVALQPADNVRNGLLDSFHGKTIGIGTKNRSQNACTYTPHRQTYLSPSFCFSSDVVHPKNGWFDCEKDNNSICVVGRWMDG